MRVLFGLIASFALIAALAADEPEPKLEKKTKTEKAPVEPKKDDKKEEKKEEKKDDKKDPKKDGVPDPMPPVSADDLEKTKERIVENSKQAGKRLEEKDPGTETQKIQKAILKDIDDLLNQAQNPPKDNNPQDQPMDKKGNGGEGKKQPMNGGQPKQGGSSRKERQPRPERGPMPGVSSNNKEQPMPKSELSKEPMGGNPDSTKLDPQKKTLGKFAEVYKDVWGHLPEKMRQEMDSYYREQFMPRYSELLRQYYSSLAEQKKKSGNGD